jgi:hypothetical protein
MNFIVSADRIHSGCDILANSLRKEVTLRLAAYKQPDNEYVIVEGVDGVMEFHLSMPAKVQEPGETALRSCNMVSFLETKGDVTVSLRLRSQSKQKKMEPRVNDLHVTDSRKVRHLIPVVNNIPRMKPRSAPLANVTLELKALQSIISKVSWIAENGTDLFNGLCVKFVCSDRLTAIASNGFVAAVAHTPHDSQYRGSLLVALEAVNAIRGIKGDMVSLQVYEQGIGFNITGDILCDFRFSKYVIPEDKSQFPDVASWLDGMLPRQQITGSTDELLEALDAIKYAGDEMLIKLHHKSGYVKQLPRFSTKDESVGRRSEYHVNMDWAGDDISIKVDRTALYRAVQNAGDKVVITFTNETAPFRVQSVDGSYVCGIPRFSPQEKGYMEKSY